MKYYYEGRMELSIADLEEMVAARYNLEDEVILILKRVCGNDKYSNTQDFDRYMLEKDLTMFFSVKVSIPDYEYTGGLELSLEEIERLVALHYNFRKGAVVQLEWVHGKEGYDNIQDLDRDKLQKDKTFTFSIKYNIQ